MASLRSYYTTFGTNEVVKFNNMTINSDNCYSTTDGLFRTPTSGLYLFYFSLVMSSNDNRYLTTVYIHVDNTRVLQAYDYGSNFNGGSYSVKMSHYSYSKYSRITIGTPSKYQNPSATFMLQLKEGQTVHLKLSRSAVLQGSIFVRKSWFGGHLIKALQEL